MTATRRSTSDRCCSGSSTASASSCAVPSLPAVQRSGERRSPPRAPPRQTQKKCYPSCRSKLLPIIPVAQETLVCERRVEDLVVKFCDASEMPRISHPRGKSSSTLTLLPFGGGNQRHRVQLCLRSAWADRNSRRAKIQPRERTADDANRWDVAVAAGCENENRTTSTIDVLLHTVSRICRFASYPNAGKGEAEMRRVHHIDVPV